MNTPINKNNLFDKMRSVLIEQGFSILKQDLERPWGGFLVIDEEQACRFADVFFKELSLHEIKKAGKLSPKILLVAPEKRLSWQYHNRRAEIWKVLVGRVNVVTSPNDMENTTITLSEGETVTLEQGERHRLVGLEGWGVIAELWQHTSAEHPSDEDDIIRVQDDYGRNVN